MNLTALQDIEPYNLSSVDSSLSSIVGVANSATNDYLIFAPMFIIFVIMYLVLTDKTPLQDFGYDDLRGLNIAFSSSSLIGLNMVSFGWSNNFFAVGMFVTLWLLTFIGISIYENQET